MAKYQAGMLVVYGNLGVREIETVGPQSFCGEPAKDYYTLRPYFSDSHDRSYIPTEKEDVLRPVSPAEQITVATVYKGNIIKNLIMDCQSYTKYRPNETTGGIFVSWRRKEELPTGA